MLSTLVAIVLVPAAAIPSAETALEWLQAKPGLAPEITSVLVYPIVQKLVNEDLDEAVAITALIKEPSQRVHALITAGTRLAKTEREKRIDLLSQAQTQAQAAGSPAERIQLLSRATRNWLLTTAVWAFAIESGLCAGDEWRYRLPAAGDAHEHPPLRAIALSSERPDDLNEKVTYRGTQRRYAQVRYGSPSSIRVAVVLDQVSPSEVDLYVDANRNRIIEENDRIDRQDRTWRLSLDVAIVEGDKTRFERRNVILRLGATGRTLSYAAVGYLEGTVMIGRRAVTVRRQDGDGNGFFTDTQDRLWFDLDGDGRWDAAGEQFLYSTILAIGDTRYVVRSDEAGTKLAMEKLEGTGKVQVALLERGADAGPVLELTATLVGRDGTAVGLRGAEATVPVGEYRISTLTLSIADPGGGLPWNYVFSDNGGRAEQVWYKVERDGSVVIDPIGKIELLTGLGDNATCRAGESISVQPRLFTGDGLLINTCYRGLQQAVGYGGPSARIALATTDGTPIGETQSGFA